MYGHPGKKLLFMGAEIGQWNEWNYQSSLDWHLLKWDSHRDLLAFLTELNRVYKSEPALYEDDFEWTGFQWIDFHDQDSSIISFLRKAKNPEDFLLIALNFTPVPRDNYRMGVPREGFYREILNSDAAIWGGGNVGNLGGVHTQNAPSHGEPYSISLTLPPLAAVILKPTAVDDSVPATKD
jgi:1,4-alpha-glucan branching enzyme